MGITTQFLINISDSLIMIAVMLIAIIVSLLKYRSLGRAAVFAAAGFLALAVGVALDIVHSILVVFFFDKSTFEVRETVFWIKAAFKVLLSIIGFALILFAIVVKRPEQTAT